MCFKCKFQSKKTGSTTPTNAKLLGPTVKNESKKIVKKVAIEVNCKQYKMLFPTDFNRPKKKVTRGRSTRSKSKTRDVNNVKPYTVDNFKIPLDKPESSSPSLFSKHFSSTGFKLSRKKTEVLGCVNSISGGSSSSVGTNRNSTSDNTKREKRKRFAGEDNNDIAAENIPLESAFPPLQFGIVNKNISPKKRRKLQTLISPKSPTKFFSFI